MEDFMKKLLIAALMALCAGFTFALDTEEFVPSGSLSKYTRTDYTIVNKFGTTYRSASVKYVYNFDSLGRETECLGYNSKDVLVDKITYSYNSAGKLEGSTFNNADGKKIWSTKVEYDSQGRISSESEFDEGDKLAGKTIFEYNDKDVAKGKEPKTTESYYDGEGKLLVRTITTKDKQGKTSEVDRYYGDGSLDQRQLYTYQDNKLAQIEYIEDKAQTRTRKVYRYDSKGFLSEIQIYNSNNVLYQREIFKPDAQGNPTTISIYAVSEKFGGTVSELQTQSGFSYTYR